MLWNIINEDGQEIYINNVIDLKVKIIEENVQDIFYINYKGYNVTYTMLMWDFIEYIGISPIDTLNVVSGGSPFFKHFVVAPKDKENLLKEIYFFLVDNNIDGCLMPEYKVNW